MKNLIALCKQRLKLQNATFVRIDHDDAMVAIVYKVIRPDGTPLILKICTRTKDYLHELFFLKHFAGTLPVPSIVQVVEPEPDINGAILMECLPGTLLKITDINDALAYEIGSLLARIHLNRLSGYGDLTQLNNLNSNPRDYFTMKFEEGLAECSNHLPKTLIKQCRLYYETHVNLLDSVDGPCIVHRDFRPGNIIIHNGRIQGIIDWSAGRASFAQEDFCTLEHGEWLNDHSFKKSFLLGYASIRPVPDYNSIMPLLRLSKAIAIVGFMVKSGTWNKRNTHIYQYNRKFLETFFKSQ